MSTLAQLRADVQTLDEQEARTNLIDYPARATLSRRILDALDVLMDAAGVQREGDPWEIIARMRAVVVGDSAGDVPREVRRGDAWLAGLPPDSLRWARAYLAALAPPSMAIGVLEVLAGNAEVQQRQMRESLARTAGAWYGEAD